MRNEQKRRKKKEGNFAKPLPSFRFYPFLLVSYNRWSWKIFLDQILSFFFIFWDFEWFHILEILNYNKIYCQYTYKKITKHYLGQSFRVKLVFLVRMRNFQDCERDGDEFELVRKMGFFFVEIKICDDSKVIWVQFELEFLLYFLDL